MKRTWIIAIVFLGLIIAAFFLLKGEKGSTASFDTYEGNFAIEDPGSIGRIFIASRTGSIVDLKRQKDKWVINDKYPVRKSNIELMLQTLRRVSIKYIPAKAANQNIAKEMAVHGIKVEVYDLQGEKLKSYYVGGSTSDERGTYMLMDGASQPFVVEIPGMDGSIRARFEIPETAWRDRHFLEINANDIKEVKVEYPRDKNSSFVLERAGKNYEVEPLYESTIRKKGEPIKSRADVFLKAISNAACESFENQYPDKDSIRSLLPWSVYAIRLENGDSIGLTLYPSGPLMASNFNDEPVHRFFVDCSCGDFMLAQYGVLRELLRGYEHFIN